ncbi:MAG TPA: haloacid dehalogenase type II [Candidatus Acidoferrales bacterium]|nr:haloacid dehalogenase type II [Candidatus Acidoferrales bacterium]
MPLDDVKALTFDVFGTVVDWRGTIIDELKAFGRAKGIAADWEAFTDDWKACYRPGMDAVRERRWPWTNVDAIFRKGLDELLLRYGIRGLSKTEKTHLNRVWHRLRPWADAVPGLTRLRSKYVLATLSNGDLACLVNMAKAQGLPWDCILCAEIFRHYKPDPEVYRGAIELLALAPEQIMMVAAHNYDLKAARAHGMRTAFVARPAECGPGQTADLEPEENWDLAVFSLEELAAVMQV